MSACGMIGRVAVNRLRLCCTGRVARLASPTRLVNPVQPWLPSLTVPGPAPNLPIRAFATMADNFSTMFDDVLNEDIYNFVMGAPSEKVLKMAAVKFQEAVTARMVATLFILEKYSLPCPS